jgi:hypothetical protein
MNNIIRNNSSPGGSGGAINLQSGSGVVVVQNLMYGNSAGCGGGALAIQTSTDPRTGISSLIANNTIVDNAGSGVGGFSECTFISQIYPSPDSYGDSNPTVIILNNIISGSTSYPSVNCSWFGPLSEASQPTFQNNILYNAGGTFFGSFCVDVSGKYNNIASDPQFVNPSTGDYHLKSSSSAIDSGQISLQQTFTAMTGLNLTTDLDGNPRVQNATGKGCIIDMGAYEFTGTLADCGTTETLISSLNPSTAGQSLTFTAQLTSASGVPTGTIQFFDGPTLLSTQTVSGTGSASVTTNSLAVGSHTISATYQPTGSFGAGTASLTQVINGDPITATLTCMPSPIDISNTAQLTAIVTSASGTPTGSISFTDNGASLTTQVLLSGTTSLTYTGSTAGTHNITATYTPTGPFAGGSATCSEVVNALPTISTLAVAPTTSTYGAPTTLTATVSPATSPGPGSPTGTVTFYNGASVLGTGTLAGAVATLPSVSLPGGSYNLTCTYGGSSTYAISNCNSVPVIVNAAPTALTLSSSNNPSQYLTSVTFSLHLTVNGQPSPAGSVITLSLNGQTVSLMTDATGIATYTIVTLQPGSYAVTARFTPTNNFLASSSSLMEAINTAPTAVTLTASPNPGDVSQPVTMTATVTSPSTPTPVGTGSVTFFDGSTLLGTSQLSAAGTATLAVSFSTVGVYNITAVFNGDSDFSTSTSAVLNETIVAGDFSISTLPGATAVYTGQATALNVTVASLQGFNQPLTLNCIGLPANATCTFTPASLPQGQGAANLVIQTSAPQKAGTGSTPTFAGVLGAIALLLLPGWKRRRRFLAGFSVMLLAVCVGIGIDGCASPNSISGGTPPGTYRVAVTATVPGATTGLSHSSVITLTVKSLF